MANEPLITLSPNDVRVVKELVEKVRKLPQNNPLLTTQDRPQGSPEVYIAKVPSAGIPALTLVGEAGTAGGNDQPGQANCDIYRIDISVDPPELIGVDGLNKTVYNVYQNDITEPYVVIARSKFGRWLALPSGAVTEVVYLRNNTSYDYSKGDGVYFADQEYTIPGEESDFLTAAKTFVAQTVDDGSNSSNDIDPEDMTDQSEFRLFGQWGILLEDCDIGYTKKFAVTGIHAVEVYVNHPAHRYVAPRRGTGEIETTPFSNCQILWISDEEPNEVGTGTSDPESQLRYAIVKFSDQFSCTMPCYVTEDIDGMDSFTTTPTMSYGQVNPIRIGFPVSDPKVKTDDKARAYDRNWPGGTEDLFEVTAYNPNSIGIPADCYTLMHFDPNSRQWLLSPASEPPVCEYRHFGSPVISTGNAVTGTGYLQVYQTGEGYEAWRRGVTPSFLGLTVSHSPHLKFTADRYGRFLVTLLVSFQANGATAGQTQSFSWALSVNGSITTQPIWKDQRLVQQTVTYHGGAASDVDWSRSGTLTGIVELSPSDYLELYGSWGNFGAVQVNLATRVIIQRVFY